MLVVYSLICIIVIIVIILIKYNTKIYERQRGVKSLKMSGKVGVYYDASRKFDQCLQADFKYINNCVKKVDFLANKNYVIPKVEVNKTCEELGYDFCGHDPILNMDIYWKGGTRTPQQMVSKVYPAKSWIQEKNENCAIKLLAVF